MIEIKSDVKVTFYQFAMFQETFKEFYANPKVLLDSLSPKHNRDMIFKAGEGAGRSGSFFFFSFDRKFIIKTMTKDELDLIIRLMPHLKQHYKKNPKSLLSKIIGVFTVKSKRMQSVHIMLMENVLRLKKPENLKFIFDLKGSMVDRKVSGDTKPSTTLKDENLLLTK